MRRFRLIAASALLMLGTAGMQLLRRWIAGCVIEPNQHRQQRRAE